MSATHAVEALLSAGSAAPAGAVVGILTPEGRDVAAGGRADAAGTAVTVDTVFDVASVTKVAATTTALLALVSRGEVDFDDPVARYLPGSPCAPGTSLRHLLQHRAGLWEWHPLYLAPGDPAAAIDALPLRYPLDEGRHYSDLGFMLLGRVVSVVADAPLDAAVRALVTAPLGLQRTGYGPVSAPVAASALGDAAERRMVATGEPYPVLAPSSSRSRDFAWRDGEIAGVANDGNCFHAFGGVAGHAGLFSTADDLLTLGAALAAPDEHADLWHPDAVADLFRDGPDAGQALGWRSRTVALDGREERMLWHPGFTGCALGILPEAGTAVVLLSNRLLAAEPATAAPLTTEALWLTALPELLGDQTSRDTEGTRTP
jgi:CubicO group peptidase (beta-lactamase class C family)